MISLLMLILNTITNVLLYVLKAVLSIATWVTRKFFGVMKLFYVLLPVTCVLFTLLMCVNLFILLDNVDVVMGAGVDIIPGTTDISGEDIIPEVDLPVEVIDEDQVRKDTGLLLDKAKRNTLVLSRVLYTFWNNKCGRYRGTAMYIPLIVLTLILIIPVIAGLLCVSVFTSFGAVLFVLVVVDGVLYVFRAVAGSTFVGQASSRYYRLFPAAGRRHYEKKYDRWLKDKNREIEEDEKNSKRRKASDFYGDEEDCDEEYYEEYDDEEYDDEEYYDEEYDHEYDDEDEEYDEEYDEEEYDRDYDREKRKTPGASSATGTFDFFAGCTSRESVDKKYRSLVKLYHPDNMDGDTAALQEINVQYEKAKKKF